MVDSVAVGSPTTDTAGREVDEQSISLHQEQLNVAIKSVVTGEIEISTVTRLRDVAIDEALVSQHADVERVAIGRVVQDVPNIREEDGVLVIPVVEEIVVVERRLVLKEEVHIRRSTTTRRHQETVTLREQEAIVTRTPTASASDAIRPDGVSATQEDPLP